MTNHLAKDASAETCKTYYESIGELLSHIRLEELNLNATKYNLPVMKAANPTTNHKTPNYNNKLKQNGRRS